MNIAKPIFIVGSGRSGTTLLYSLLSSHPDVCWFSNLTNAYPSLPELALLHNAVHVLSKIHRARFVPICPSEGESIYRYCGFRDDRKMTANDVTDRLSDRMNHIISRHLDLTRKSRFINKRTANTQRIACLNALFPDAYFIHIIRDGKAVAYSLCRTDWWGNTPLWWKNGKTPRGLHNGPYDLLKLAAFHWQNNIEEIRAHKRTLKGRYMEVRYEQLVRSPWSCIEQIVKFVGLPSVSSYISSLPTTLPDRNNKWRTELNKNEKQVLAESIGDFQSKIGYD